MRKEVHFNETIILVRKKILESMEKYIAQLIQDLENTAQNPPTKPWFELPEDFEMPTYNGIYDDEGNKIEPD